MQKTNAMRALDRHKIPYETHTFSDAIRSADDPARQDGLTKYECMIMH